MQVESVMDTLNRQAYESLLAVRAYGRSEALLPAEQAVLRKLAPELRDRKLLDLGVGGGRTTSAMLRISHDYMAVDYSQSLVDLAKRRTGVAAIFHADVRDMRKLFKAESFDFVLFSFNGIDYMPHDGRLAALSEIHRVLKPGGRFLFSSHNRAAAVPCRTAPLFVEHDAAALRWRKSPGRPGHSFFGQIVDKRRGAIVDDRLAIAIMSLDEFEARCR